MRKYQTNDIKRASFQIAGGFALFRHVNIAGTNEFLNEDFKGNIRTSIVEPTISFESFVEEEVKKMLDERAG